MLKLPQRKTTKIEVVVAAYNENLNWVEQITHPIYVYHKGKNPSINAAFLPNIGRESHTYIHHVVAHYHQLADITIFCQGNPFDHCPQFLEIANLDSLDAMNDYNRHYNRQIDPDFCPLSKVVWDTTAQENIENKWDYMYRLPQALIVLELCFPRHQAIQKFTGVWGAMFAISKQRIHKFPKQTYQKLLDFHQEYWSMPWAMENVWMHLFHKKYHPLKSINI